MVGKLRKNIHVENFCFRETVHSIPPLVFLLWGSSDYVNSERSDPHTKGSSLYCMAKTVMRPLSYVHSSLVLAIKMALFHISVYIFLLCLSIGSIVSSRSLSNIWFS